MVRRRLFNPLAPAYGQKTGGRVGGGDFKREKFPITPNPPQKTYKKKLYGGDALQYRLRPKSVKKDMNSKMTDKQYNNQVNATQRRYVVPYGEEPFDKLSNITVNASPEKPIKHGNSTYGVVPRPTSSGGNGDDKVAAITRESVSVMKGNRLMAERTTHKTNFESGRPASKALKLLGKINGVARNVTFDTKVQIPTSPTVSRDQLTWNHGFNSRNFNLLPRFAYVNYDDIRLQLPLDTLDAMPSNKDATYYASVLECVNELQIFNQSNDFPIKVKIHLIDATGSADESTGSSFQTNFSTKIFNTSLSTQTEGAIPVDYQHSLVLTENFSPSSRNQQNTVDTSLKHKGLYSSNFFKENYDIVKTFSKTLNPSDTWQFKHTHHCGAGIDISALTITDASVTGNVLYFQPIPYFIIIETRGVQCECQYRNNNGELGTYLGTSPGYYMAEYRKSVKFVQASATGTDITANGIADRMHVRVFQNDLLTNFSLATREFFLSPDRIFNKTGATLTNNEGSIPIAVDYTNRFAKTTSSGAEDPSAI